MAEYKLDKGAMYAKSHEWVRLEEGIAVVGISDAAQDMLSDVVYVELPEVGDEVRAGHKAAVVESVKAAEEVISPVSGMVTEVNASLVDTPEIVNERPYQAWFFKVQPNEALAAELADLMDAPAYAQFVAENAH
jgi:glycine cleavage system H protein